MAASRKQVAMIVIAVMLVLHITVGWRILGIERFSPMEGVVSLLALLPIIAVGALIWFGIEVVSSLRRIETALQNDSIEPEFFHGS